MRAATSTISVSLPSDLLKALDEDLSRAGESRSAAVRRLIAAAHRAECARKAQEAKDVAQWVRSYEEMPQTADEVGWNDAVAAENWAELPYEE
jgi:metal-responsive CopG/Arc/MetJ family transcriptional regulator